MLKKEVLNFLLPVETEVRGTPARDRYPDDSRGSRQSRCSVGGKQSFPEVGPDLRCLSSGGKTGIYWRLTSAARAIRLRWLPPVLHFPESLNFTKGFLTHHDGLVPVVVRWCYNSFYLLNSCAPNINFVSMATIQRSKYTLYLQFDCTLHKK